MENKLIKLVKEIGKFSELKDALFLNNFSHSNSDIFVEGTWKFKNYPNNEANSLRSLYILQREKKDVKTLTSTLQDKRIILSAVSPCFSKLGYLLQDDDCCYINVSSEGEQVTSINLKDLDIHGKVYSDSTLSSFCWSFDSKYIAFVAEKNIPKRTTYLSKKLELNSEGWGQKYAFIDDWGEQMGGQSQSVVVVVDTKTDDVKVLHLPDEVCGGQVVWTPQNTLIGVAFVAKPFRIGLIYCTNRESMLFHLDLDGSYSEVTEKGNHVQSPRFCPDGSKLVFLQSPIGGPHVRSAQLCVMNWPEKKISIVLDIVPKEIRLNADEIFYGLSGASVLPQNCWSDDGKTVVISSPNNFAYGTYLIDTETKQIKGVKSENNLLALDVQGNFILASHSSLTNPPRIALIPLNSDLEKKDMMFLSFPNVVQGIPRDWLCQWAFETQSLDSSLSIPVIYFGPTQAEAGSCKRPLIVWVHGGPHSMIRNEFLGNASFFVRLGYSILFPNYRGSLGQGNASLESLPGHCGTADAEDVYQATLQCLTKFVSVLDPSRVALFGGSHGGFLVTHLASQHPELYQVVSTRNPVIDIASMTTSTDIPDWNFVESGFSYSFGQNTDGKILSHMFQMSPLSLVDRVKAPTLILLGKEDRRVPASQGVTYYKMLLARNIEAKLYVYDDCHPLGKVGVEADVLIQTALWYEKFLNK